jgi:hypothetical protein
MSSRTLRDHNDGSSKAMLLNPGYVYPKFKTIALEDPSMWAVGSHRQQTEKYESRGTRNRESLCSRGPTEI